MILSQRIEAFSKLGEFLQQFSISGIKNTENSKFNELFFDVFKKQIEISQNYNGWFTKESILIAFESWSKVLTQENLEKWISKYNISETTNQKKIALIMAGNIPLVGFHDFLSVLISGNNVIIKLSSNDKHFLPLIAKFLEYYNPLLKGKIEFTDKKLTNFEGVIATGSDNSARYFEYYFGKYPSIIRKNRNSVAVISGDETNDELEALGDDIFQYFGLGCRNVSKIFVPKNYNFDLLFNALYKFKDIINYKKYENNYDYNKAVYLMSNFTLIENGFLMLKEDSSYSSPIATLFYEYYDNFSALESKFESDKDKIQCIVSNINGFNHIKFGQSQSPKLWDYADNIDTIEFLQKI